ncbi:hypothetical protein F0562_033862 [Nyssa sinensis]|uniref:Uncharacterized protein n=1 Tax=Nyssa sinensis TaxID=561372 RepID=A0A5J5AGJ7_9ASTE|nr:hypothetical protein F0562_033862 [Nyssa sinensis]
MNSLSLSPKKPSSHSPHRWWISTISFVKYSMFVSTMTICAMIGAITSGQLADFIGHKGAGWDFGEALSHLRHVTTGSNVQHNYIIGFCSLSTNQILSGITILLQDKEVDGLQDIIDDKWVKINIRCVREFKRLYLLYIGRFISRSLLSFPDLLFVV